MSITNHSQVQINVNSPNYKLACELGYELSNQDYIDVFNYAKLVQSEYLRADTSPKPLKTVKALSEVSESPLACNNDRQKYSEDLWIKHLREYFESGMNV